MNKTPSKLNLITATDLLFWLFILVWWLELNQRVDFLGRIRFEFILGSLLLILAIKRIIQGNIKLINPVAVASVLYLLVLLVSLPFSVAFEYSWQVYWNRVLKLALMAYFMLAFISTVFHLKMYFVATFVAFFKIGYEAFYGKVTGNMVWENQGVMRLHGAAGSMFGHPNSLSGKFLGVFPFLWYLFPILSRRWKFLSLVLYVFLFNILIFTGSRTGYLSFFLMVFYIAFASKNKMKAWLVCMVLFVFSAMFIPEQYQERFMSAFTGQEKQGRSSDTRKELLKDSVAVFLKNPLGVGVGAFVIVQQQEGRNAQDTHNLYTQILSETGVQGFFAFGFLIIVIFRAINGNGQRLNQIKRKIEKSKELMCTYHEFEILFSNYLDEVRFLLRICSAIKLFLVVRLLLGIFGHDLYENYWWIAAGTAMAIETCINNLEISFVAFSSKGRNLDEGSLFQVANTGNKGTKIQRDVR